MERQEGRPTALYRRDRPPSRSQCEATSRKVTKIDHPRRCHHPHYWYCTGHRGELIILIWSVS
ncbi:MAG: hypothetical protein FVQ85_10795 [Planctomycetes bacterium]|nr:hypothetical protein [Planctomycetota bacterium]